MKRWKVYLGIAVVLAAAAAVLLPQYADYTVRAAVSEGIMSTYGYREQLTVAIQEDGKLPLAPARMPKPAAAGFSRVVQSVSATPNGEMRITFKGYPSIEGRSIVYVPTLTGGVVQTWSCYNVDMPERELSPLCRAKRP